MWSRTKSERSVPTSRVGFYRQLPKLAEGHLAGYPRVFGIAWAFVAHTDSRFDTDALCRFVKAYQRVQPLTIGELWAVAITLRIVLVENLRRSAEQIVRRRTARQEADALADRLLAAVNRDRPLWKRRSSPTTGSLSRQPSRFSWFKGSGTRTLQ